MNDALNRLFQKHALGYGAYDNDAIIKDLLVVIAIEKRQLLLTFCDRVVWEDKREHITTERIDKFLAEGK